MYSYVQEKNNTIIMVFPDTEYEIIQFYEDLKNHKGFRECKKLHLFFPNVWSVKELLMLRCVLPTTKIVVHGYHIYPGSDIYRATETDPKIVFDDTYKVIFTSENSKFEKIYYMDKQKLKITKVDKRTGNYGNISYKKFCYNDFT